MASHVHSSLAPGITRYLQNLDNIQTNKQASMQATEQTSKQGGSSSTCPILSFEARLCIDWISERLPHYRLAKAICGFASQEETRRDLRHVSPWPNPACSSALLYPCLCTYRACLEPPHFMDEIMHGGAGLCGRARVSVVVAIGRKIHKAGNSFKYIRPFRRGTRQTRPRHEPNTSRPHTQHHQSSDGESEN